MRAPECSHHTEKDVALANEEEDHELSHATDDEDFQVRPFGPASSWHPALPDRG